MSGELESTGAQEVTGLYPSGAAGASRLVLDTVSSISSGRGGYTYRTQVGFGISSGAAANVAPPAPPSPHEPEHDDDLSWLSDLPMTDLAQFLDELTSAVADAKVRCSPVDLVQLMTEWRATAEVYKDPEVLTALTSESNGDFGAVLRP